MTRAEILSQLTTRTAQPERGQTGTRRLVTHANAALRHIWGRLPRNLTREEVRFELEMPYSTGTLQVHESDAHVLVLIDQPAGTLPLDGRLSARWLEVQREGQWIQRRIREVFGGVVYKGTARDQIVIDEPWENLTDTGMAYRIWTAEYPYDGDVRDVSDLVIAPESGGTIPLELLASSLDIERFVGGWRATGRPSAAAKGSAFQLPAPHYTPGVALTPNPTDPQKWGYDDAGVERGSAYGAGQTYGPAGTFSYRVCHGWGRRKWLHPTKGSGLLRPFYISSPSPASAQQATTWGASGINVGTPDVDYVYGFGNDPTLPSFGHSGIEKWFFRARHATQPEGAGNNAAETTAEADEVYYLCCVTDASTKLWRDKGQFDPVDRWHPLRDHHGHQHIKFDKISTDRGHVRMIVSRRPLTMDFDADAPNIPVEALEVLLARTEWEIARRAGNLVGQTDANARFEAAIADLISAAGSRGAFEQAPLQRVLPGPARVGYGPYTVRLS